VTDVSAARRAVTLVFALNGALIGSWAVRIPAIKSNLGLSDGTLGLALASIAVGSLLAMPLAGWLSARLGSRITTRVTLVWFCVAIMLPGLASSLPLLALATFNLGASTGSLDVAMNAHGVAVERRHPRAILSSFHAAWSLGGLVGAAIGGVAAGAGVGVGAHLAAGGAFGMLIALPISRALLPADADVASADDGPLLVRPPRALWALGAVALCGLVAEGASGDWSAVYMHDSLGTNPGLAAATFAAFSLAMTTGRLVGDRLTELWGPGGARAPRWRARRRRHRRGAADRAAGGRDRRLHVSRPRPRRDRPERLPRRRARAGHRLGHRARRGLDDGLRGLPRRPADHRRAGPAHVAAERAVGAGRACRGDHRFGRARAPRGRA
jgi:hypothetical protein